MSVRRKRTGALVMIPQTAGRMTQLTSRVSEADPRVTMFEPSSTGEGDERSLSTSKGNVGRFSDESDDEVATTTRIRKRVKLETGTDLADLEDLAYSPHRSLRKARRTMVHEKADEDEVEYESNISLKRKKRSTTASPSKSKHSDANASPSKAKAKAKPVPQELETPHPAPPNWREVYDMIKAMRSRFVAPVDTMGCAQAQTGEIDPRNQRYASLVSLMLSSQTKDEVTNAAINNLRSALGGSISLEGMIDAEDSVIAEAISKVGFWRRKTGYLKQAALKLRDDFDSDVPKTVDELCSLPGVGPKMSFLTLQIAWGLNHGIGVDVHIHRITNLLGWHKPPTKNPEQTRLNLQSWLPKDLHYEINHLLVGFGQVICLPVSPRCDVCELSSKGLCPSARKVTKISKSRKEIVFLNDKEVVAGEQEEGPRVEVVLEDEVEESRILGS